MSEFEDHNPYSSPSEEGNGPPTRLSYRPAIRLFVLPFFLAHLVYWPVFFLTLKMTGGQNYGLDGLLFGTISLGVAGIVYGAVTGLRLRAGAMGNVDTLHPALYAVGQGIWFVICVFAPCAVFVGLA